MLMRRPRPSYAYVQVEPLATVREGHRIAHLVVDAIKREIPGVQDVVTHLEPYEGPPTGPTATP